AISISKLSSEYELIIITSFGLNPTGILKILLPTTILMSLLLLVISLGLIPKALFLKDNFINKKKQEAQFNIQAGEYGQRIGHWFIYVDKKEKNTFKNMTLLKLEQNKDTLISSNQTTTNTRENTITMNLTDGKSFTISDTIQQIDFKTMLLVNTTAKVKNIKTLDDFISYWDDRNSNLSKSKDFTFSILISLFPLVSIFFILATGYFNPRYNTNKTTILSTLVLVTFVVFANKISWIYPNASLIFLPMFWFIIGYIYYHLTTKKLY
ncbi:MAG: permease, partial [Epsilonproteobacteria bacterium]